MKALSYTVGNFELEQADHQGELDEIQGHVGGYIDDASMTRRWACYVDDEGLIKQKPIGLILKGQGFTKELAGNALFIGIDDNGESRDLTDEEVAEIKNSVQFFFPPIYNYEVN